MTTVQQQVFNKEQARYATLSFFLAQGLCFSSWASRIPDIKEIFASDYLFYWGLILFLIPVGKFLAIPIAGYLVTKLSSSVMVRFSIAGYALSLLAIGWVPSIYLLGVFLFSFGIFWNLCDISLNTQGIAIERAYGRAIIASFHGGWSLAACLGALIGFGMIVWEVSPGYHFLLIALLIGIILLISGRYLTNDRPAESTEKTKEKGEKPWYLKKPETLYCN